MMNTIDFRSLEVRTLVASMKDKDLRDLTATIQQVLYERAQRPQPPAEGDCAEPEKLDTERVMSYNKETAQGPVLASQASTQAAGALGGERRRRDLATESERSRQFRERAEDEQAIEKMAQNMAEVSPMVLTKMICRHDVQLHRVRQRLREVDEALRLGQEMQNIHTRELARIEKHATFTRGMVAEQHSQMETVAAALRSMEEWLDQLSRAFNGRR